MKTLRNQIQEKIGAISARLQELSQRFILMRFGAESDPARVKFLSSIVQKLQELERILDELDEEAVEDYRRTISRLEDFVSTQVSPDLYVDDAWRVADTLKIEMVPLLTVNRLFATLLF